MDGIDALSHANCSPSCLSGVKGHPSRRFPDLILHREPQSNGCADIPSCELGIGVDKAMIIKAAFALAKRLVEERPQSGGSWSVQSSGSTFTGARAF